jgi:hypothetical protein
VLGQQVEAHASDVGEPLVGRYARETQGGPAFERKQVLCKRTPVPPVLPLCQPALTEPIGKEYHQP